MANCSGAPLLRPLKMSAIFSAMIDVQVDPAKQLLSLSYSQHVDVEDMKRGMQQIKHALVDLRPGFRLLNNLSGLETMELGCAEQIMDIMKLCNDHGIATAVRVIPDPMKDIGFNIMSRFHYSSKGYLRIYVNLAVPVKISALAVALPSTRFPSQ